MSLNILRFPSFQSAAILPEHIKTFYKDKLEAWFRTERPQKLLSEGEKASTQRLIDYLDIVKTPHKNTAETPKLYNDFKAFFEQFDVRRGHDFREVFKGPIADWYDTLKADVPSPEQILNKELVFHTSDRAGDPATTEDYAGGDDAHEVGGWDTKTDALGGVKVE